MKSRGMADSSGPGARAREVNHAAGEGRGGLAVSLAAAAPCELCAALWDRRVPDSALANAAGARARNGASCGAASCPMDLQRMISDITVKPPASGDARDPAYDGPHFLLKVVIEGGIAPASPSAAPIMLHSGWCVEYEGARFPSPTAPTGWCRVRVELRACPRRVDDQQRVGDTSEREKVSMYVFRACSSSRFGSRRRSRRRRGYQLGLRPRRVC